jgi:CheY-like chemotaxis protein
MPQGGVLEVSASNVQIDRSSGMALPDGRYIKVVFKDHGIGIPAEYLQKIFDPFFTTKQAGSGLGLATCWSIVNRHDGIITVESEAGKGSVFSVFLPASTGSVRASNPAHDDGFVGNGHILVMDDEEPIRDILEEMLGNLGYTVATARTGEEAVSLFERACTEGTPFDVVMVDLTIPGGMGGKETLQRLLELDKGVRVIASSGYSEDPVISSPREFGFAVSIRKPYRTQELREALKRVFAEQNRL